MRVRAGTKEEVRKVDMALQEVLDPKELEAMIGEYKKGFSLHAENGVQFIDPLLAIIPLDNLLLRFAAVDSIAKNRRVPQEVRRVATAFLTDLTNELDSRVQS